MTIHQLRQLVSEDFEAVNALINAKTQSHISLINDLSQHIVQSGGKRLRPLLVLLASKACLYQGKDHIILATMVEFFHTATLLHDDVVDNSTLRRGKETANEIWGSKASILVGDHLFTQYMQLMISVGNMHIMKLLTDISYEVGCGELKQLGNRKNPGLTEEEYFEVIRSKTSLLFAASATLGALISEQEKKVQDALFDYGLHVGNAFQLIDDALDYCSDANTLGKNVGDDLADGKPTLPLIHAYKKGNSDQKNCISEAIQQGSLTNLPQILTAISDTKAIEYTRSVAQAEIDKALSALTALPESEYKEGLKLLALYAIERNH
jgi:octaprenyl-diphosphate synthase